MCSMDDHSPHPPVEQGGLVVRTQLISSTHINYIVELVEYVWVEFVAGSRQEVNTLGT